MSKIDMGRIIGLMVLVQVIGGVAVNLFLTAPLFGSPGFITNGAAYSQQIGFSVLIGLVTSGLSLAMAIVAFPAFRLTNPGLSTGLVAMSAVALAAAAVEHIGVMSMVSFSEVYTGAGDAEQQVLESAKVIVASARNWAHYIGLVLSGCTLFLFYLLLFFSRLVPRWLAGLGLIAVLLQLSSVSRPLLGGDVIFELLAPLGLTQILLSIWLMARGFRQKGMEAE